MDLKEQYLTPNSLGNEISRLRDSICQFQRNTRNWNATIGKSGLIILDLQNYFFDPTSHAYIPSAPTILGNIEMIADFFRQHNRPVIFTRHLNDDSDAGSMAYWWRDLIRDNTRESELIQGMAKKSDIIIIKSQFDAFYRSSLQEILQDFRVLHPVVCGVMTNLCCESTVRSAFVHGFRPVMPLDGTAAYNREFHLATFRNLCFGYMPLRTTEEIIQELQT